MLTDNETIKALECCREKHICSIPYVDNVDLTAPPHTALLADNIKFEDICVEHILDLINRLQAEIESKQATIDSFTDIGKFYSEIKAEAYKEFAERAKSIFNCGVMPSYFVRNSIDNLLKELVGEDNGESSNLL